MLVVKFEEALEGHEHLHVCMEVSTGLGPREGLMVGNLEQEIKV